jgi:shikimate kinase
MVGLMGVGKSTVGGDLAARLGWAFRDSDADILAATGSTVRELRDRDGVGPMHALEAQHLLDALAAPVRSVIGAAASVADDPACLQALRASDVFVVWLQAAPELLADRFGSSDDHRPAYGDSIEGFLGRQLAARGAALASVADLVVDVADRTPGEVTDVIVDSLR